ncbi:MAG: ABC transporter substrate-binding protein [Acidimicrobiales bacterium]
MAPRPTPSRRFRRLGAAGTLAAIGLLVAACGSPPATEGSGGGRGEGDEAKVSAEDCPLDALDEASGPVKIKMWFGGLVEPPVTVLTDMVKDFNASQDKVQLTADNQGNAYAEVLRKYQGAAATPDQLPQIIYLEDTMLGEMVDKGQVLPAEACMLADDYDPEQIPAAARAAYSVDDVLYPGYMNVSTPILYYNKVHFEKAGLDPDSPPRTLAEIQEAAKVLKDKGVSKKPFSFKADQWFVSTWLAGVGQDVVNNDNGRSEPATEATFDTDKGRELFEWLDSMNQEKLLNAFPVTDGSIDHYLALITEESSMLVETSTASSTIAAALGGELNAEDAGIDVGSIALDGKKLVPGSGPYPGMEAPGQIYASGGAFYILNTGSKAEQAAAWQFLKFMLQPDNAKKWHLEGGYLPVVKSIISDPDILDFQKSDLGGNLLKPAVDQLATADPDRSGPLIAPYPQFQDILQGALEDVLFAGADPDAAVASANKDATALLQDYNGD